MSPHRAATRLIIAGYLGIAGFFVGWATRDAAACDLLAVAMLVLAAGVDRGRDRYVLAAINVVLLSLAQYALALGALLWRPDRRTDASGWGGAAGAAYFTAVMLWLLFTAWSLERCRRRLAREHTGRCIHCGYDLRGSPGATCPECGSAGREDPDGHLSTEDR